MDEILTADKIHVYGLSLPEPTTRSHYFHSWILHINYIASLYAAMAKVRDALYPYAIIHTIRTSLLPNIYRTAVYRRGSKALRRSADVLYTRTASILREIEKEAIYKKQTQAPNIKHSFLSLLSLMQSNSCTATSPLCLLSLANLEAAINAL